MKYSHDSKLDVAEVHTGDRVTLRIHAHNYEKTGETITGEVIDAPEREYERECLRRHERIMADFRVKADDGEVWRWAVDNNYVHSTEHPHDIGKFAGFYEPESEQ